MRKILIQIMACLLIPALIADPVTASVFSSPSPSRSYIPHCDRGIFQEEALAVLSRIFPHPNTLNGEPTAQLDRTLSAAAPPANHTIQTSQNYAKREPLLLEPTDEMRRRISEANELIQRHHGNDAELMAILKEARTTLYEGMPRLGHYDADRNEIWQDRLALGHPVAAAVTKYHEAIHAKIHRRYQPKDDVERLIEEIVVTYKEMEYFFSRFTVQEQDDYLRYLTEDPHIRHTNYTILVHELRQPGKDWHHPPSILWSVIGYVAGYARKTYLDKSLALLELLERPEKGAMVLSPAGSDRPPANYLEHEEQIDRRWLEPAFDPHAPWIEAQRLRRTEPSVTLAQSFFENLRLGPELVRTFDALVESSERNQGPGISRIWIKNPPANIGKAPYGHASDRGLYVFSDAQAPLSVDREAAIIVHEFMAYCGLSHEEAMAYETMFDLWNEGGAEHAPELTKPLYQSVNTIQQMIGEKGRPSDLSLTLSLNEIQEKMENAVLNKFKSGVWLLKQYLEALDSITRIAPSDPLMRFATELTGIWVLGPPLKADKVITLLQRVYARLEKLSRQGSRSVALVPLRHRDYASPSEDRPPKQPAAAPQGPQPVTGELETLLQKLKPLVAEAVQLSGTTQYDVYLYGGRVWGERQMASEEKNSDEADIDIFVDGPGHDPAVRLLVDRLEELRKKHELPLHVVDADVQFDFTKSFPDMPPEYWSYSQETGSDQQAVFQQRELHRIRSRGSLLYRGAKSGAPHMPILEKAHHMYTRDELIEMGFPGAYLPEAGANGETRFEMVEDLSEPNGLGWEPKQDPKKRPQIPVQEIRLVLLNRVQKDARSAKADPKQLLFIFDRSNFNYLGRLSVALRSDGEGPYYTNDRDEKGEVEGAYRGQFLMDRAIVLLLHKSPGRRWRSEALKLLSADHRKALERLAMNPFIRVLHRPTSDEDYWEFAAPLSDTSKGGGTIAAATPAAQAAPGGDSILKLIQKTRDAINNRWDPEGVIRWCLVVFSLSSAPILIYFAIRPTVVSLIQSNSSWVVPAFLIELIGGLVVSVYGQVQIHERSHASVLLRHGIFYERKALKVVPDESFNRLPISTQFWVILKPAVVSIVMMLATFMEYELVQHHFILNLPDFVFVNMPLYLWGSCLAGDMLNLVPFGNSDGHRVLDLLRSYRRRERQVADVNRISDAKLAQPSPFLSGTESTRRFKSAA